MNVIYCEWHCLFVLINGKGEHMLSISFKDDIRSDCCCYCLVIVMEFMEVVWFNLLQKELESRQPVSKSVRAIESRSK